MIDMTGMRAGVAGGIGIEKVLDTAVHRRHITVEAEGPGTLGHAVTLHVVINLADGQCFWMLRRKALKCN